MGKKETRLIIQHFHSEKPIQSNLLSNTTENFCTVRLVDKLSLEIKKGDPVILGALNSQSQIKVIGGNVVGLLVDSSNFDNLVITTDKEDIANEKRQFERFPVSLLGGFKREGLSKIYEASVKDISYSGMRIYSDEDIEVGEEVKLDIYLKDSVKFFVCRIIRKAQYFGRYEYGLTIIHNDRNSIDVTEMFINALRSKQFDFFEKFV